VLASWANCDCMGHIKDYRNCIDGKLYSKLCYHMNKQKVVELKMLYCSVILKLKMLQSSNAQVHMIY
jgi:hypothetical protein